MSHRLKLIVAYDGAPFAGWQSQSHRNTVQDHIERAFERVTGGAARIHGAGRTDAGVHALAQCAHVNLANRFLPAERWVEALNALLPQAIRILRCRYVSQDFHARLSAKGKIYRYRIWNASVLPPFEYRRAWHIARPVDLKVMKSAAKHFVGTHDFAAFAANRGKPEPSTIRTINSVRVRKRSVHHDRVRRRRLPLQDGSADGGRIGAVCAGQNAYRRNHFAAALRQNRICTFHRSPPKDCISCACATRAPCRLSVLTYLGNGCLRVTR